MASYKQGRTASDIKMCLAQIFRELKDPRISELLSIVKVDVTGDLSLAKVYVSAIEGEQKTKESVKGLQNAAGYIRRELSRALKIRQTPELKFIADDSIAHGAHISRIIEGFEHEADAENSVLDDISGNDVSEE